MPEHLSIGPLSRTSPSLAEDMRNCGLRAGLASAAGADRWVLHDPRSWLGIAFHRLMQLAAAGTPEGALEDAWNTEITAAAQRATAHPLDRRFGRPEQWPAYYLMRQRALATSKDLAARRPRKGDSASGTARKASQSEHTYVARGGKLIGRPDRLEGDVVIEYKSSLPGADDPESEATERYARQVRIYAAIIAEARGSWPTRGLIAGASGRRLEIEINPNACDAEADRAVAELDAWNDTLRKTSAPSDIASPSDDVCAWCRFQTICPAFWAWMRTRPSSPFPGPAAAEGAAADIERGHDGDRFTLFLTDLRSTHTILSDQGIVMRLSLHGEPGPVQRGERRRLVSVRSRGDGRIQASIWTIMAAESALPAILVQKQSAAPGSADTR